MTATGGFVTRSMRGSFEVQTSTAAAIGPGSYEPPSTQVVPAAAPFHTTVERNAMEPTGMAAVTPGVGAYDAHRALDAVQCKHIKPLGFSANFASGTARLHTDKTRIAVPGPGAYKDDDQWGPKGPHYTAPPSKQRINFTRGPSAPSIPAPHQSFGYDEGQNGQLVMQSTQNVVHSGEKGNTVGPGAYDPKPAAPGKISNAVAWNGNIKRGLIIKSDTPGPGAYNPTKDARKANNSIVVAINGVEVQFGGATGSASFASKVPLPAHSQPQEHQKTPGPGAYNVEPLTATAAAAAARAPPTELQFFGSAARRSCQVDPMKSLSAPTYYRTPGPGAYDDKRTKGGLRLGEPMPFDSTSSRFMQASSSAPGPGQYKPDQVVSLAKDVETRASVGKAGVFGSQAPRWKASEAAAQAAAPGPGNYDPKPVADIKPTKRGEAANFVSRTDRWRAQSAPPTAPDLINYDPQNAQGEPPKGHPSRLGPGAYQVQDQWSKKGHPGYKIAAFGSEAKRSSPIVGNGTTPGPGRYNQQVDVNQVYSVYHAPSKDTVFGSNQARFKGPGSFTPGPGYYNTAGDFVRKTHNITYTHPGSA